MYRLESLSQLVWETVPESAAEPLGVVTTLGGATFLLFALSLLYWVEDRRSTAVVVSYAFLALAVVFTLKAAIGLPRPPEAVHMLPLEDDPYGFPSGHTVAAVIVYSGLVTARDRIDDWRAVAGAALIVALVGFSRVGLGVHYVGDVLFGAALGLAILGFCHYVVGDEPVRAFALAAAVSAVGLFVSGFAPDALLGFGGSLGGIVGTARLDLFGELRSRLEAVVLVVLGVPFIIVTDTLADTVGSPVLVVSLYAVLVAGILLLPAFVARLPTESVRPTRS